MSHEIPGPVVELNAEQLTACMGEAVRAALDACEVTPTRLEDGSQERFVSVSSESIDASYLQLREVVSADGSATTYEYGFNSYHDVEYTHGFKWSEGGATVEWVRGDRGDSRKPRSRVDFGEVVREVDPTVFAYTGGFKNGNEYFGYVKALIGGVPGLRARQLQQEALHAEERSGQRGFLGGLLDRLIRR
jgi:hypothetical protein